MTDLIDKILAIGSTPDWISPAIGIIQESTKSSAHLCFHRSTSVNQAKRQLRRAGIKYWNDFIDGEYGYISVSPENEERAKKVLGIE